MGWKNEDLSPKNDGGIERIQVKAGEGLTNPSDGAAVEGMPFFILKYFFIKFLKFIVHLIGTYEGRVFDERDVSFTVGEGSEQNIIPGIEHALEKFTKGETSKLVIKPQYAFGSQGSTEFNIPPNATIEYTVTLKTFERPKESWALDAKERVEQANLFKEKGTQYFKASKFQLAVKMYKKVLEFIENEKG